MNQETIDNMQPCIMADKIRDMEGSLIGDKFHPEGLIHTTEILRQDVSDLKKAVIKAQYFISGAVFVSGLLFTIINFLIK